MVFFNTAGNSVRLELAQRCINNFSLVFQFSLILTIAYGWKATCWKIKEFSCLNFNELRTRRAVYIAVCATMFVMWLLASTVLVVYQLVTDTISEMVINMFDLILEASIFSACVVQMTEGRKLASLLSAYEITLGMKVNKCRVSASLLSSTCCTSLPSR